MRFNHLALATRDQQQSIEFYARYFGFDPATAHLYPDGVIIVKDAHGFALALGHDTGLVRAPGFPHFGFETAAPDVVRDLRARLIADGVELVEDEDEDDYVGIKCLDPDGHVVEVSWEPQQVRREAAGWQAVRAHREPVYRVFIRALGQDEWLALLSSCPATEVSLWRPHDFNEVVEGLR